MFTGSVYDNVSYGDNGKEKPSLDKVKEAL